jgi:hypothetical protein
MKSHFQLVKYNQPCPLKFAARCLPLGLTGYGETEEEAWEKLIRMFDSMIKIAVKYKEYKEVEK